MSNTSLTNWPT